MLAQVRRNIDSGIRPTIKGIQGSIGGSTDIISQVFREYGVNGKRNVPESAVPSAELVSPSEQELPSSEPPKNYEEVFLGIHVSQQIIIKKLSELEKKLAFDARPEIGIAADITTEEDSRNRAQRLRNRGKSIEEIAKSVGQTPRWVERNTKGPRKIRPTIVDEISEAKKMKRSGNSYSAIARRLKRSWGWAKLHAG